MTKRDAAARHQVDAARAVLADEQVLTAGIFGWQDLMKAQLVVGAASAGRSATRAAVSSHGLTMQLLVAVTDRVIAIYNWDGHAAGDRVEVFERATTAVRVSWVGLSRIAKLHDEASGAEITLYATVVPYLSQSKADRRVLAALTATS